VAYDGSLRDECCDYVGPLTTEHCLYLWIHKLIDCSGNILAGIKFVVCLIVN